MSSDGGAETLHEHLVEPVREQFREELAGELARLVREGLTPAQALDYYFVERGTYSQTEIAEIRDVSPQTVSERVRTARERLDEESGEN